MQPSVVRGALVTLNHHLRSQLSLRNVARVSNPSTLVSTNTNLLAVDCAEKLIPDDPDGYDKEEFDKDKRKHPFYYKYEIAKWARQGSIGLRKALELFHEMKSRDRLTPTVENFSPLIYGCAKAGYTKRAFELYEESLKYNSKPTRSTVTCLINACAESPFSDYGLKRLDWLMTHLKVDMNVDMNLTHYNCAIKAYGKLGRLDEASRLVQEMISNDIVPDAITFNNLLVGCASQRDAGCSIALRVFKRMKLFNYRPTIETYRLLLRCIRDCGMGPNKYLSQTIGELPSVSSLEQRIMYNKQRQSKSSKERFLQNFVWTPLLSDLGDSLQEILHNQSSSQVELQNCKLKDQKVQCDDDNIVEIPNTLSDTATSMIVAQVPDKPLSLLSGDHLDLVRRIQSIDLQKLKKPFERLILFGGIHGFLASMMEDQCKPDIKTFSLILNCIEPTRENHIQYFDLACKLNIERDVLFYALLIRHICDNIKDRKRLDFALTFLEKMNYENLKPNITVFEALATGCCNWNQAERLISDMKRCGLTVSHLMFREMFNTAIFNRDFYYLNQLTFIARHHAFNPSKRLVEKLEACRLRRHNELVKQEQGRNEGYAMSEQDISLYDEFSKNMGLWLNQVEIEEEEHPWSQFHFDSRKASREGFERFVEHFRAMKDVRHEAQKRGQNRFGNISSAALSRMQNIKKI